MGYLHIENLYKRPDFLKMFKRVYVLEKIHGTSAHVCITPTEIRFFKGGVDLQTRFESLFDREMLRSNYEQKFTDAVLTFFGEAYGGNMQAMSDVYGKELRFVVFDVQYERNGVKHWMNVPNAAALTDNFGFDFVWHEEIDNELEQLNYYRDMPSVQSSRLGISEDGESEGIVIKPIYECYDHHGGRYIIKHKRDKFRETAKKRATNTEEDLLKLEVIRNAEAVADEWVTEMRLSHVMDKVQPASMQDIPKLIEAMQEDIVREAGNEIDWTEKKRILGLIGKKTVQLYKDHLQCQLTKNFSRERGGAKRP